MADEEITNVEETKEPKKRGRKPNPDKKNYFGPEEEEAFRYYVTCKNEAEKNKVFNEKLYPAFTKMIESLIRRYNLFIPDEDFDMTFNDTLSNLMTKISKFESEKGKKAYSYCGTICKNYLIARRTNLMKKGGKMVSYDKFYTDTRPDNRVDDSDETDIFNEPSLETNVIKEVLYAIEDIITADNPDIPLNDNDRKIANALIEILNNWDKIFEFTNSRKYNRSSITYFLKENTGLNTKEIRESMKKFKQLYAETKETYVSNF